MLFVIVVVTRIFKNYFCCYGVSAVLLPCLCVVTKQQPQTDKKTLFATSLNFLDISCLAIDTAPGPFDCKRRHEFWQENGVRVDTVSRRCWRRISMPNMFRRFGGTSTGNCWLPPLYERLYMWWSLFLLSVLRATRNIFATWSAGFLMYVVRS